MKPHVAIPAKDLNRSKAFYTLLGFSVTQEWQRPDWGLTGCFMEHRSGLSIELIFHEKNKSITFPATAEVLHVAVPVENVEIAVRDLVAAGIELVRPVTDGITVKRLAFIKDPSGFTVELYEPK